MELEELKNHESSEEHIDRQLPKEQETPQEPNTPIRPISEITPITPPRQSEPKENLESEKKRKIVTTKKGISKKIRHSFTFN